jgi:hypothetical protein
VDDCIAQIVELNSLADAGQIAVGQELVLPVASSQAEPSLDEPLRYDVVYSLSTARFDGGKTLYVLIEPVDLTTSAFKDDVRGIVRTLVAQNGAKTSIEIHDARSSLETSYKQYGALSLGRNRTAAEDEDQALHYVAAFSGDLSTGIYQNTLEFFIAASSSHSVVGPLVSYEQFNP